MSVPTGDPTNPIVVPPVVPPATPPADTPPAKTYTADEMEIIVKERLARDRQGAEAAAKKAKDDAEKAGLKEKEEFKTLAEKHEARVKELEPLEPKLQRLTDALNKQLDAAKKDLPKHILALLEKMDPEIQLEWLAEHRADVMPTEEGNPPPTRGVPPTPKGKEHAESKDEKVAKARQELRQTGRYSA